MENLRLTLMDRTDAGWLNVLLADEDVRRYLPHLTTSAHDFIYDMQRAMETGLGELWAIRLDDLGIGFIAVYDIGDNPFIFYAMLSAYRNKGYMKKSLQMLDPSRFGVLHTCVDPENVPSLRVLTNGGDPKVNKDRTGYPFSLSFGISIRQKN